MTLFLSRLPANVLSRDSVLTQHSTTSRLPSFIHHQTLTSARQTEAIHSHLVDLLLPWGELAMASPSPPEDLSVLSAISTPSSYATAAQTPGPPLDDNGPPYDFSETRPLPRELERQCQIFIEEQLCTCHPTADQVTPR